MQRYFNTVTTRSGDVISGALVTVKDADGNVATIYSDTDGATEQDNPISTDSNGFFGFYAADGTYSLTITGSRMRPITITGIMLGAVDTDLSESGGSALIGFIQSGTGAVARTAQDKGRDVANILDFIDADERAGIKAGTSTYDATTDIATAFAAHDSVDFGPEGWLFNVSTVPLAAGKSLVTRGRGPTFQQIAGQSAGTVILDVQGSNVTIGNLKVRGNIATDTSEFNHGIYVNAREATGDLENIVIGRVHGEDIRGDIVYTGQMAGYTLRKVICGFVTGDNILRNGISIVGLDGGQYDGADIDRNGFTAIDVESDVGAGVCRNIRIGRVKGRHFGLVSQGVSDYIENVEVGVVDLSPSHSAQSSPSYTTGESVEDGLLLRNVKSARIGMFKATGYDRAAAFVTYDTGELGCEDLEIGTAIVSDCSNDDATYNSYFVWPSLATNNLRIGHLDVTIDASGKSAVLNCYAGNIRSVKATVHDDSRLLHACQDMQIGSVQQSGGSLGISCTRVGYKGGVYSGSTMLAYSSDCSLSDLSATASVTLFSNGDLHMADNATLNTVKWSGSTAASGSGYLRPLKLGNGYIWASSDGKLRINTSFPANDTDGTVVGTQS